MPDEPKDPGAPNPSDNPNPVPAPSVAPPTITESWLNHVPETVRGEKSLSKFKGSKPEEAVGPLAQAYVNLERMLGNRIAIPGPDAKPEEISAFREKLGVPKDPGGYELKVTVPEGVPWDKSLETSFAAKAHQFGLTKAQAQDLMNWYAQEYVTSNDQLTTQANEAKSKAWEVLKGQWGAATQRNVALAQRTLAEFGGPELVAVLDTQGLGNHPAMLKFLAVVGQAMLEDGLIEGAGVESREDIQAQIDKVVRDKAHPYYNRESPDHQKAIEHVKGLYKVLYSLK